MPANSNKQPIAESQIPAFESHGERRRRQLIEVAAHIIETEGVDAIRLPRVAELAGCARTLSYRYFPQREDLLLAVLTELYARVDSHLDGIRSFTGTDPDAVKAMLRSIWQEVSAKGLGGLILHNTLPMRVSAKNDDRQNAAIQRFQDRWLSPYRDLGLSPVEATVVARSSAHILMELVLQWRDGEIDAEQAIEIWRRSITGQIQSLLQPAAGSPSASPTHQ